MKIDYMPAKGENQGPRYIVRPENHDEQKFLTILRDILMPKSHRLRMIGTEHSEKNVANMPAKPVTLASLCVEDRAGKCPPEFRPNESKDVADPTRHIPRTEQADVPIAAVMDGHGKMRVVRQGDKTIVEERETH
jgi:hypothetical protein